MKNLENHELLTITGGELPPSTNPHYANDTGDLFYGLITGFFSGVADALKNCKCN